MEKRYYVIIDDSVNTSNDDCKNSAVGCVRYAWLTEEKAIEESCNPHNLLVAIVPKGLPLEEQAFATEALRYRAIHKPDDLLWLSEIWGPDKALIEFWPLIHKVVSAGFQGECRELKYNLLLTIKEWDL